ncbi:MAG: signal peptide peptidase SppA [Rhizobiaceae bacterium]|nr:signal peptide peptidase SppA [Rhizobiaceae bacterium]MCV0404999.1 signal peptide peptidase SppA [Rhizobiaceae bacterium]
MAARADELIDRRRLRRKVTFWRVAAIMIAAAAIISVALWGTQGRFSGAAASHIAKIKIDGTITEKDELLERLDRVRESGAVKGVIISINSPGGTTAGGEAIFESVRRIAAEKPVVAQVGTLAASAGYMVATAADHIVARKSSIVGSIGVLVQFPDVTALMDYIGVKMESVKSSPLKAEPSPFTPTTDEERTMISRMILDSYDWFIGLVDERRPLDRAEVERLADGSIFTGRQALERKLVDELGGELEAKAWLTSKGVDEGLEIIEWKDRPTGVGALLLGSAAGALMEAFGLPANMRGLMGNSGADRIFLDGLLSVWQPETGT